jgi:hypothetical protein
VSSSDSPSSDGEVKRNPRLPASASLESYKGTPAYDALLSIYEALQSQRGHHSFVLSDSLPNCDFLVPKPGFLVEFDESQHFTASRKLALSLYPKDCIFGFDRSRWIKLCDEIGARDNQPPYRDEQRAWYDTLRDFMPQVLKMLPTIRLYAGEFKWCALNPANPDDLVTFRQIIGERTDFWTLDFRVPRSASLGRLVIDGPWSGNVFLARKLLNDVAQKWPSGLGLECLATCGAFIVFPWPDSLPLQADNRFPDDRAIEELQRLGRFAVEQLLSDGLRKRLAKGADYLTVGVDTKKAKISSTDNHIPQPHAEMVFVVNLHNGEVHFTGKSYPTPNQTRGLLRIQHLESHFLTICGKETMVLGCHDLTMFNPRSDATATGWRAEVKEKFKAIAHRRKPVQVLHHPHTTVKRMTWQHAWYGLLKEIPTVQSYLGTGCYSCRDSRNGFKRDSLESVLTSTRSNGKQVVMDVLVHLAAMRGT